MRVFLTGATGFIGDHIRHALVQHGHHVIALARRAMPDESDVTWVAGDLAQQDALVRGMAGCEAVINLVGIIRGSCEQFIEVHVHGTEAIITAMRQAEISRLLHMSALGVGPHAKTEYYCTKWQAEELVRASGIAYTIFRPSMAFGPHDHLFNMLAHQIKLLPIIPVIGDGKYQFAPISVHALSQAFLQALTRDETQGKVCELCGPQVLNYMQILDVLCTHLHRHRRYVHLPASLVAFTVTLAQAFRIPTPITRAELDMLMQGNVCSSDAASHLFDLPQITLAEGIREYL